MSAQPKEWPQLVDRYAIYAPIARGGMATVHLGRLMGSAGFSRTVAIKRMHEQFAGDPDFVAMFLDEARLAARIQHPNVLPTLDVVSSGEQLLLIMEYVVGESLSKLLRTAAEKHKPIPPPIAAAVIVGVLRGLDAAHEARNEQGEPLNLVHRDVSPQNVMVGRDGITRVFDFGIAKAEGRSHTTRNGEVRGKAAYMAPEQATGADVTRRADLFAAGSVFWEMLVGERLFGKGSPTELLLRVVRQTIIGPKEALRNQAAEGTSPDHAIDVDVDAVNEGALDPVIDALDPIVLRALDRDPENRYPTARSMADAIEHAIRPAGPTAVAAWVEELAGEELAARALRIDEVERSSTRTQLTLASPTTHPEISTSAPPPIRAPRVTWPIALAMVAVAIALLAVTWATRTSSSSQPAPSTAEANGASSAKSEPMAKTSTATTPNHDADSGSTALPIPTASASSIPSTKLSSSATPRPWPSSSWTGKPLGAASAWVKPAAPNCNPPYTYDAQGIKHYKPECM